VTVAESVTVTVAVTVAVAETVIRSPYTLFNLPFSPIYVKYRGR